VLTVVGSLIAANNLFLKPVVGSSYSLVSQARIKNKSISAKAAWTSDVLQSKMDYGAILIPLAVGIGGSMVASKLGVNKYVGKLPVVGKKLMF
jgi:hypothetical protein